MISSFYLEENMTEDNLLNDEYSKALKYNENLFLGMEKEDYDTILNYASTQIMATIQIPVIDDASLTIRVKTWY